MSGTPIQKWSRLCREIEKTIKVFEKTGVARRTVSYKKAKIDDYQKWLKEFDLITAEIDKTFITNSPDPCYEVKTIEIREISEKYFQDLKVISEEVSSELNQTKRNDTLTDAQLYYQRQKTRFESLQKSIDDVDEKIASGETLTQAYCKVKNKSIADKWQRIQSMHEECEFDLEDLPVNYEIQIQDLEVSMESTMMLLQEGMEDQKEGAGVKLPNLTIPKFNGDYFKWMSFRDLFCATVKDKKSLTNGQKMQLLKGAVIGEAETLIEDLTVADVNFNCAWDRLEGRYENNRIVVFKYLNKFVAQPICKSESKSIKKLLDTTDQILLSLKNLKRPVSKWDDWIVLLLSQKLSEEVRKDWEKSISNAKEVPTWEQMKTFLEEEFRILEGVEGTKKHGNTDPKTMERSSNSSNDKWKQNGIKMYQVSVTNEKTACPACENNHGLFACEKFKAMDPSERWDLAKKAKLCFSCLQKHKEVLKCDRKKPCKKCDKPHNTWLHVVKNTITAAVATLNPIKEKDEKQVLLATMLINIIDQYGRQISFRALVDSGSQGSMMTTRVAEMLQTVQMPSSNDIRLSINCYIMNELVKPLPDSEFSIDHWNHLKGLQLADPKFNKIGPVDLLLGVDVIGEILRPGFKIGDKGSPMAQETSFGWIISGNIHMKPPRKEIKCLTITEQDNDLSKFWELEELTTERVLTQDELECENLYKENYHRDENGTFTVKIPFKQGKFGPENLGSSKAQCMARFFQLEKRLERDAALREEYVKVMTEYLNLGHMELVDDLGDLQKKYYIPHHAVVREESLTTKTRVVFDASAKTSTGWSLNDCMHTGAKQQSDLMMILLKWRTHKIVFKADIEKMYRMIKLDKDDQQYHTILWRNNTKEKIKEYQLTTATFGTAAAPFMATRSLNQIAYDCEEKFPKASKIIKEDFYVDDLISGASDLETALQSKNELMTSLMGANMKLRKWTSNSSELLESLPNEMTEKSLQTFEEKDSTKALGLQWNPVTDKFNFNVITPPIGETLSKRQMLSQASKVFDPLGWLAPVVLKPKLMMQEVYNLKTGWDEQLPEHIKEKWFDFSKQLPELGAVDIKRWIEYEKDDEIQIHGFCDASEVAYAAVVYTRVKNAGKVEIRLVASKTRVAPIKTRTTLPRLELCGSVLLAHLMTSVGKALCVKKNAMTVWSDSMVALGWLRGDPNKWKTFVANRVSECQSTKIDNWNYVPSEDNPADCVSRGISPGELQNHPLWWTGPKWLTENEDAWPNLEVESTEKEQRKVAINVMTVQEENLELKFSSWFKTVRVLAYMLRMKQRSSTGSRLTMEELETAKRILYKKCQRECFPEEVNRLSTQKKISTKSKLLGLNPFMDKYGIMRVGGRLGKAEISYDNKHPIILPDGHETTKMIIKQMHLDTLHGGPQLMLNLLRKKYWIIQGKRMTTNEYKSCINCRRFSRKMGQQLMADLPKNRVTLERAFLHVGVDYAGPIEVKTSKIRNSKAVKGYIAVFVCFGTKAIHLELVSDLTTEAFMAALNRFVARRGLCQKIYSDNGTNFLGTANKIQDQERKMLIQRNEELANSVGNRGINWSFIPPGAPTFGGLWERGVRSVKDHLKKTLKTLKLTFEEYATVLCQIEACLNSRPLCPLTSDPDDLNVLTPGHFLIGDALMAQPQPMLLDIAANHVNRWKHLQLIQQHFWTRWNTEYLTQLQQRSKWKTDGIKVELGDIVLLRDEQLAPTNWLMGRIVTKHPGPDNRTRVVTVKTKNGEIKRPIGKICPLFFKL